MGARNSGPAPTAEGLRLAAALKEYRLITDKTQGDVADRHGVGQQTAGSWERTGRIQPRYVPAIKVMLAEAGITIEEQTGPDPGPDSQVCLRRLARAAMMHRLTAGPELNETERSIMKDLSGEVPEAELTVAALIIRIGRGLPLGEGEGTLFRETFAMNPVVTE